MAKSKPEFEDTDIPATPSGTTHQLERHSACQFLSTKPWLELQYHDDKKTIKKPNELEEDMKSPPDEVDRETLNRIQGSMIGMALGDALGAHVEFRPHAYMLENPVEKLEGGGTWGLQAGQFTDDTSMALCLANSLVTRKDYVPYDQLVRYKWWHKKGYMSSTGSCFDIGAATKNALDEFERRQKGFADEHHIPRRDIDYMDDKKFLGKFDVFCSEEGVAGNGALMRLAPIPLFFYRDPILAVEYSGHSGEITHGDKKARDACRYYGALIVAAIHGASRAELLDDDFFQKHKGWFSKTPLAPEIAEIAAGSYKKKGGHKDGIRGKGYIVNALEAALWAFWYHKKSFEDGALAAVNLGDDTDTTAAIYGQLAGAYYGYRKLRKEWRKQVYAKRFLKCLSKWIVYEGDRWSQKRLSASSKSTTKKQNKRSKTPGEDVDAESESSTEDEASPGPRPNPRERRMSHVPDCITKLRNNEASENRPNSAGRDSKDRITRNSSKTSWDPAETFYLKLEKMGDDYAKYTDRFKKRILRNYNFSDITEKILHDCGITNEDHRQKIFRQIQIIQEKLASIQEAED